MDAPPGYNPASAAIWLHSCLEVQENNLIHNTFHVREGDGYIIPRARIWNNIFLVGGQASMEVREGADDFRNNAYHGKWKKLPDDPAAVLANPLFHDPAPGRDVASTFRNHALRSGSPCRGKGFIVPDHGGRDLKGSPVPAQAPPDLGALQSSDKLGLQGN